MVAVLFFNHNISSLLKILLTFPIILVDFIYFFYYRFSYIAKPLTHMDS